MAPPSHSHSFQSVPGPPRSQGILPKPDEFSFTTAKRKFWKINSKTGRILFYNSKKKILENQFKLQ